MKEKHACIRTYVKKGACMKIIFNHFSNEKKIFAYL